MKKEQLKQIIKEEIQNVLNENTNIDQILDKISSKGINSLSPHDKQYLDAYSQEKELPPMDEWFLDNGTLRDAFFISGDKDLEIDKDIFINYVLTHKNKLKKMWNETGGNWDQDQITDDEIRQAADKFYELYPERYDHFFYDREKKYRNSNARHLRSLYYSSPRGIFAQNVMLLFDEDIENLWLEIFLNDLEKVI